MGGKPKMALIIAQPGPLRNSLLSLLTTMPQINLVAESRDMTSLAQMAAQIQPDIILIAAKFAQDQLSEVIRTVKNTWSVSPTIVLVDDPLEKREAEQAAADVVLFTGFRAANLIAVVENLLPQETLVNHTPSRFTTTLAN